MDIKMAVFFAKEKSNGPSAIRDSHGTDKSLCVAGY